MPKGVTSLNIKNENGSFTNVPIAVKAENVKLNNGKNLEDSVAYLDTEKIDSGIEAPIKTPLYQEDVVDHLYSSSSITPLSAAQGKVLQNEIDTLKTAGTVPSDTLSSEIIDIRNGGNGKVYPSAGTAVRSQLSAKEDRSNKISSKHPVTGELLPAGKNEKYPTINFLQQFYYDISQIDELIEQAKNQIGTADWAELKDLRVGADGKQYDNAGLAIRTNIKNVLNEIDKQLMIFGLTKTMLFDKDYNLVGTPSDKTTFSGGGFSQLLSKDNTDKDKVKYVFIPSKVTALKSGTYMPCTKITDVYINNSNENIVLDNDAFPSTATIHYVNELTSTDAIINIFPLLNIYRQILNISAPTINNIVELDAISLESQLNNANNMDKTYLFNVFSPLATQLNVDTGTLCTLNNYHNYQVLTAITDISGIKTFIRFKTPAAQWNSFVDRTIPSKSITSTKYADDSIKIQHINSDYIDTMTPSNTSGPESDGNVLITSAAVYNALQNIESQSKIVSNTELDNCTDIGITYQVNITDDNAENFGLSTGEICYLTCSANTHAMATLYQKVTIPGSDTIYRRYRNYNSNWTAWEQFTPSSDEAITALSSEMNSFRNQLANKADIEIGDEFDYTATYDSNSHMTGIYTLIGDLCFIIAKAHIRSGWSDIDYPLPVAALVNSACIATDGNKTYRVSTDSTQSPTHLYIHTIAEEGKQNEGDISFCLAYRYI